MKNRLTILLLLLLFVATTSANANIQWRYISTNDGLSNRRVMGVAKDGDGYIWFASRYGVDRFDGSSIAQYKIEGDEALMGIVTAPSGEMIAYTRKGIYRYDENGDKFLLQSHLSQLADTIPYTRSSIINSITFDGSGVCWVAMNRGVLYSSDLVEWYDIKALEGVHSLCFTAMDGGVMAVGTRQGVSSIVDYRVVDNMSLGFDLDSINKLYIRTLFYDKEYKQLWIGTVGSGLYLYCVEGGELTKAEDSERRYPIRAITQVSQDEVWVGMDGVGVKCYERATGKLRSTYTTSTVNMPLSSNSIYSIFRDERTIYISTYSSGVMCYNNQSAIKQHHLNLPSLSRDLMDRYNVNCVIQDRRGVLWLGTNSGVVRVDSDEYLERGISRSETLLAGEVILTIFEDSDGDVWVGGYSSELSCFRGGERMETIDLKSEGVGMNRNQFINAITQSKDGTIYIGGITTPLVSYSKRSGDVVRYPKVSSVETIFNLDEKELLIGSYRGLHLFNRESGEVSQIKATYLNKSGEQIGRQPSINSIIRDTKYQNILWLTSENDGLIRYNLKSNVMTQYTSEDGLPSNSLYSGVFDSENRLWLSAASGICCVERDGESFSFTNFANNETFNIRACCLLASGNVLYSNLLGVVEIKPKALIDEAHSSKASSNIHFSEFRISYDKVLPTEEGSPLRVSIDKTQSIELRHDQNSFSFYFADVQTHFDGAIEYQYRLVGFEDRWSEASTANSAVYTNISPGRYTFEVRSIDPTTGEAREVRAIDIKITPPIYLTTVAYIIYVLLVILLSGVVVMYLRWRIKQRNAEEKINFFTNMAHDIRIPITLVMAPLNELEGESEISDDGRNALIVAKKNINKLFKLVTELLDFQRMALQPNPLLVEQTEINEYIKNTSRGFALMAHEKRLEFNINLLSRPTQVWIDRGGVSKVLENLLSNAIKYTPRGGVVTLSLSLDAGHLTISVSDTGIGIPAKSRRKIFTPFYRAENTAQIKEVGSGIGLLLTRKLVESHHGKMSFSSKENEGSCFVVELPYNKSQYDISEISERLEEEIVDMPNEGDDNRRKVLIVEDNDELRSYLARYLRKLYIVQEAADGVEALESIAINAPDIIVSDIIMPRMKGTELCERVKGNIETSHIPFIILSSVSEKDDIISGLKIGADDYITKPFDLSILESKISTILTNRSLARRQFVDTSAFDEFDEYMGELDREFMRRVVDTIDDNLTNPELSVDILAQHMAMSRSVFFKKFKALTEKSPKDFIRDTKMKHAAKLICEQKITIAEVAYSIGFPDAKYFSTAFKKYYGTTPTGYLEKMKQDLNR